MRQHIHNLIGDYDTGYINTFHGFCVSVLQEDSHAVQYPRSFGMEEERRLAFVAMTRAEKRLYLSGAEGRSFDGSPRYLSRFVLDIDSSLLEYTEKPNDTLIADAREYIASIEKYMPENLESTLLPIGVRVRHEYLGEGNILEIDMGKGAYLIKFDSIPTPRTISFRAKILRV